VPDLREAIWQKLRSGELPAHRPDDFSAGRGGGAPCDGCAETVNLTDMASRLRYPDRTLEMHLECAALWAALRLSVHPDADRPG
jgi:hypothetical protein